MFFDFDPSELAPDLAAIKQREQLRAQLARLEGKEGSTDDNKAEIKELKKLLSEQQKQLAEQKKDQDKQKKDHDLLFELSIQLADLDERIGQDDQFEAAAKDFIDLHGKLDSALLSHKKYDTLEFKELAIKTGKSFERLVTNPKLKIFIAELAEAEEKERAEAEEKNRAIEKQKRAERAERAEAEEKNRAIEKQKRAQRRVERAEAEEKKRAEAEKKKHAEAEKKDQKLLLKISAQLEDLDERIGQDDQFEAAAKEFIDLHGKLDSDLSNDKRYNTLEFKELAIKTSGLYAALIKNPKLKIRIEEAESWLELEAEEKAKEETESWLQFEVEKKTKEADKKEPVTKRKIPFLKGLVSLLRSKK